MKSLTSATIKGFGWSAIEKFSIQGLTFLLQIILARLLDPSDYGIIGMLAIFMQIGQVFVDTGFANALIQKKQCQQSDYSTVFIYNLGVSVAIYLLFFFIAPYVALFYNTPELTNVMRVISITIVFNAIPIVNRTILIKAVNFKIIAKISLIATLTSGIFGIALAYYGYGVWALCYQTILLSIIQAILFYFYEKWRPTLEFSMKSFNSLFKFGSKMLLTNLIGAFYTNMYTLVIGKRFSKHELGNYSRADQFASFPASSFVSIVSRVVYPVFCKIQDDNDKLRTAYRKIIRLSSFLIFPVMIGLMSVSQPFIYTFLTGKWNGAVILLQILCLDWILDHLSSINLNLLYVKGRTDLALKLEIFKKIIAVFILLVSLNFGLIAMCYGRALYSVIATVINTTYTKKYLSLSIFDQVKDILPFLIGAIVMGVGIVIVINFFSSCVIQLIIGIVVGILLYLFISFLFFKSTLQELVNIKKLLSK